MMLKFMNLTTISQNTPTLISCIKSMKSAKQINMLENKVRVK